AALDKGKVRTDLIRAIDRQIEFWRLIERAQWNAKPRGITAGRLRGRHPNHVEARTDAPAEEFDEVTRRRTRAQAEPHSGLDRFQRPGSGGAFLSLNVH